MEIKNIVIQLLDVKTINDILDKNNHSLDGFIIEAIVKILAIDKNIKSINVSYDQIYDGQMSDVKISNGIKDIKQIFNEKVSNNSGGKSDFTFKYGDTFIFTSSKYESTFNPGKSDIERLFNEATNDLGLKPSEFKLAFVCKDKNIIINHNHQHPNVQKYFDTIIENKLLFDLEDIKKGISEFHKLYKNWPYGEYVEHVNSNFLGNSRQILIERLHQKMTLYNFIRNFEKGESQHLISHKTRTGKSITQLLIIKWFNR